MFCDYPKTPTAEKPVNEKCNSTQTASGCKTKNDKCRCYIQLN